MRRTLFDEPRLDSTALAALVAQALGTSAEDGDREQPDGSGPGPSQISIFGTLETDRTDESDRYRSLNPALTDTLDQTRRSMRGRRQQTVSDDRRGRYIRSEQASPDASAGDVALDATIRAAAEHQLVRAGSSDLAISIEPGELRQKVRTRKVGASIVFCVDASGSMGATNRMSAAKSAVLDLLVDAYQRRDRVSLVSFRGDTAEVVLAPTASVELANVRLRDLATGGATPLAAGIVRALELIDSERRRSPDTIPWLVLVTDGRGNVGIDGGLGSADAQTAAARVRTSGVNAVLLDTGGHNSSSAVRDLAREAGAEYVTLPAITGQMISSALRQRVSSER
jgi:magnesium chelatase subunit D